MTKLQRITPNLWFADQAEEAAQFYTSIFKNSKLGRISRYGEEGVDVHGQVPGTAMTVEFQIEGQDFVALNGGPQFTFSEAISFIVNCHSQQEVDYYWARLSEDGEEQPCGWLKDKYGVSWQIVPTVLVELMNDSDAEKAQRVTRAMLQMKKIEIAKLEAAYRGEAGS